MVNNKAAWLPEAHGQFEVRDGPEPLVGEYDVLIENKAVAINPGMVTAPWKWFKVGSLLRSVSGLEDSGLRCLCQEVPNRKSLKQGLKYDGVTNSP